MREANSLYVKVKDRLIVGAHYQGIWYQVSQVDPDCYTGEYKVVENHDRYGGLYRRRIMTLEEMKEIGLPWPIVEAIKANEQVKAR